MLEVSGEIRVFANEIEVGKGKKAVYNCQLGSKCIDPDAKKKEWLNCYINVNLSKKLEDEVKDCITKKVNYVDLILKDCWFSCYKGKDEKTVPVLFINKAKVVK